MRKLNLFRWFLCKVLDMHTPSYTIKHDGASYVSRCKYCGKRIMQDSKGNWF